LGLNIEFRQSPEEYIRPEPSKGFSKSHFVIADIKPLRHNAQYKDYEGLLVYAKSSLREQKEFKKKMDSISFLYKIYHPQFPHESTADQFFDKPQWKAYYTLGRFIAGDLLQVDVTKDDQEESLDCDDWTIDRLFKRFDRIKKDSLDDILKYWEKRNKKNETS
jgi:hypothetical protein